MIMIDFDNLSCYIKSAIRLRAFLIGSNTPYKWQKELVGKQLLTFSFILIIFIKSGLQINLIFVNMYMSKVKGERDYGTNLHNYIYG